MVELAKIEKRLARMNIPKTPKGYRVPADAPEEVKQAADFAFQRLIDVASGRVSKEKGPVILKAAVELRKETCGPIAQKVDVDIKGRLEHLLTQSLDEPPALPGVVDAQVLPAQTETAQGVEPRAADAANPIG
jgi:hypothetical protein